MGKTKAEKRAEKVAKFVKQIKEADTKDFGLLDDVVAELAEVVPIDSVLAPFIALADEMPLCTDDDCPPSVRLVYIRWQDRCGVPSHHRTLPKNAFRVLKEATE